MKESKFRSEPGSCIWMKSRERKNLLVKDYVPRDVYPTLRKVQALKPFVRIAITKKDTTLRSKLKLASNVGAKI